MKKYISRFKNYLPLFCILFIWLVFASPYFLKGLVPFPSTYQVNHFPPWSSFPGLWGPVKNGAMPDIIDQIYPWRYLAIEIWKSGQIPLWNPYNFSGNPHLANFQSAVLSPFNVLFFIFPFIDGWSILVLLQPLLAGIFTYLFLRELKVSSRGSIISATTFMFCGFLVTWMAYGTLALAISFLPLALFAIEKYLATKRVWYLILLSFTFPLSFFSGHFQTSVYFTLFVISYILFKFITTGEKQKTLLLLFYVLFGVMLTLPQVLPSIEFYLYSVRSEIFNTGGGIPLNYLITVFSPDFYGNPVTRNDWFGQYAEWASFIGIIPLTFAFFAITLRRNANILFFFTLGVVSLLLSLDTPLQQLIGSLRIPVFSTSYPARLIVLFSFSFCALSGFGVDSFLEQVKRRNMKIFIPLLFTALCITIAWVIVLTGGLDSLEHINIARRNLILPSVLFGCMVFGVAISYGKKELAPYVVIFALLLASFDSVRFAAKWMPFETSEKVFITIPVIEAMKKEIKTDRYFGNLGAQIASYYGLSSLDGYDPLYIKRYGEFIRSSATGDLTSAERSVVKMPRIGDNVDRVLDLLGVSIIFHPVGDTNQSWAYPVWEKDDRLKKIYQDEKFELYRNTESLSRVYLFYDYEVLSDAKKVMNRIYDPEFDTKRILILENKPSEQVQSGTGSAQVIEYLPNKVLIKTTSTASALLFLADNYYPGWVASIDGTPSKILRADYTFRSVVVPEGVHEVEFKYEPKSFQYGLGGFLLGIIGITGTTWFTNKNSKLKIKNSK